MDFRIENGCVSFWIKVKPRSSREQLTVDSSGELRLALHAVPTEGQANEACVAFLARTLHVPRSCVQIVTGEKARRKLIRIRGSAEIANALQHAAGREHRRTADNGQRT